jgi:hypothetical protein
MRTSLLRLRRLWDSMTLEPERAWAQMIAARLPEALGLERLARAEVPRPRVVSWELLSDPDLRG